MKLLLPAVVVLVSLLAAAAPAAAQQQDTTKEQDIRTLIELTQADKIGLQIGEALQVQMVQTLRRSRPDISQQHLELLTDETNKIIREELPQLIEIIVSLYAERFTQEEIRDTIAFFRTPTGQKLMSEQAGLVAESMQMGQQWGRSFVPVLRERLEKRMQELGN